MDINSNSSSDFIYNNIIQEGEKDFTNFSELPSQGFNILIKAKRFGKWFLLKGLKEEYRHDPVYQKVLRKEFEIMASLSHPSVVSVFSLEEVHPYGTCIVMEYVDGITLVEFMLHPQSTDQRLRVFYNILDAMRYIHANQVTHRDLKPSNILVTHNNRNVKIIDFGLSDTDYFSILKEPAGTQQYMSPEQQSGSTPDARNDIYSLGVILMNLNLGKSYQSVVKRCVAPIEQRYADVDQLEKALDEVTNRKKSRWTIILTTVTVILAALIAWQGVLIQDLSEERSSSANTINAMKNQIRESDLAHNEKLKQQSKIITEMSDSLERVDSMRQKWNKQQEHEKLFTQNVENGKREMDRYIKATKFIQFMDTLSSYNNYMNSEYYSTFYTKLWEHVTVYCKGLDSRLTEDERTQIWLLVNQYVTNHYTEKWNEKLDKLSSKS